MTRRRLPFTLTPALLLIASLAAAQAPLRIASAGPTGEVSGAEQAREIRIVFSEPMVALAQVPKDLKPSFFHLSPGAGGTFRWSGTTTLIFTPAKALPLATTYEVRIDPSVTAVSGHRLAEPYTFSFTTPTARLLQTHWYRPGGKAAGAPIIVLRFNQPVKPEQVAAHLSAAFQPHPFTPPVLTAAQQIRLAAVDANALEAFNDKVQRTRVAAAATSAVQLTLARDWDKKKYPASKDLVVLQATTPVPTDAWVRLELDGRVPSLAGKAVSAKSQDYTIRAERTFFVDGFHCIRECDPDLGNPIRVRAAVNADVFAKALKAVDITNPQQEKPLTAAPPKPRDSFELNDSELLTFDGAGYPSQPPVSTWLAILPPTITAADGQTLGYTWVGSVENWHQRAFTSFGDGHGVWEKDGGATLPFYGRNFQNVRQWAAPVDPQQIMPTLLKLEDSHFQSAPDTTPMARRLGGTPDRVLSHGLDLSGALKPSGTGIVWTAVEEGTPIARSHALLGKGETPLVRASMVQVTNLALSVKDSPQNTLIFVTTLDTAKPVAGAHVSMVGRDGAAVWTGTTGPDGLALAPQSRLRDPQRYDKVAFIVTAEKDGDNAYLVSDWNDGIMPWDFGLRYDLDEADPLLRGSVFTDRGVYKLGEEVHLKAILRSNTPTGIKLLADGTPVEITVWDGRDKVVDQRTITVNGWSTGEWTMTVPAEGVLGEYRVRAALPSDKRPAPRGRQADESDVYPYNKLVNGTFLVAAYRRPDFRVDVALAGDTLTAGTPIKGTVTGRYLFGAPMNARPVHWTLTKSPIFNAPAAVTAKFPDDRWTFVGYPSDDALARVPPDAGKADASLSATGQLALSLPTDLKAGLPLSYTLEGDVEDVSRQHIANRASIVVHPAPWYVGIKRLPLFNDQRDGVKTEIVAVGLDGNPVADVDVTVTLTQIQWQSVRRAEGNGFYTWDTERKAVPAGQWHVKSGLQPVPFTAPLPAGGYFTVEARADAGDGRFTITTESFYALGAGYTAWQRYDHNRIDLVADRKTYKPGDTARILIQSPWEQATAIVTTEREGIRTYKPFTLTSTQQSIDVPITEDDIPNVFVSVLLVKGRTKPLGDATKEDDPSDPGKPAFRLGYAELEVEDANRRLHVAVAANQQEYRPAANAHVTVDVKDRQGRGTASEVTLWAVDYGVLSLTDYHTPDVLKAVYQRKALQVLTEDARQKIVSRRVVTPKGDTDGGGGGADAGVSSVRRDFRVLAFWLGSVATDGNGHATADVKLPESLTTYRIMAVAGDRASRFGSADAEIRINKPVTLKATFPRFLAVGDKASFGAVVTSQLKAGGPGRVTIESLDPSILQFGDTTPKIAEVPAGGSVEVRFDAAGRAIGRARVRVTVSLNGETDAFEDVIPVEIMVSPETVSAVGEADAAKPGAQAISVPAAAVANFGGLHVDLASTALVGLGDGARYLVEYPYGCAEQRGSRALALLLSADLGEAFKLPGIEASELRATVQSSLHELERYQCESGGFAYWAGDCSSTSPYLTAYLLHVFKVASDLKYDVDAGMRQRAYGYLDTQLREKPPVDDGWWPAYTAWQAFAVKVLAEGGRNQDSNITRLYGYRERMPIFGLAYLNDALVAKGEGSGPRSADLRRRLSNAVLPEAATAHVEEMTDPYLMWFWNSNLRTTAIVLNSLVKAHADDAPYRGLVTWLLQNRQQGRWGNTQENAMALESLVNYYRTYESVTPNFTARAAMGSATLATGEFHGRTTTAQSTDIPMSQLLSSATVQRPTTPAGQPGVPLTFTATGEGTLFYAARLRYALDQAFQQGADQGIHIERTYAPYVEKGTRPSTTTFKAGDLVRVTLTLQLTKERRFVAVTDPLPAGFEPVESWFATSAAALAKAQDDQGSDDNGWRWWERGGFDHVERHDDRIDLFATRLSEGTHTFSYVVRATTAGTFRTAPAHAEEMYEPEVFGRTATANVDVRK